MSNHTLKAKEVEQAIFNIKKDRKSNRALLKKSFIEFETMMKEKYPVFSEKYPEIFKQAIMGTLDMGMFKYMLIMLKQMESGSITEHNASVKVGQVLVDKYVKPLIDEDK